MLQPPIHLIKEKLLVQEDIEDNGENFLDKNQIDPETVQIPTFLTEKIEQRCNAQILLTTTAFEQGQIRLIETTVSEQPISFLLAKQETMNDWSGWLVSHEVDYATDRDILLESEGDAPFDPVAGMIQTWNPLIIKQKKLGKLVAKLSQNRLNNITQFAKKGQKTDSPYETEAGFIGAWKWNQAQSEILSGTPLDKNNQDDPRYAYQVQYKEWAKQIENQNFIAKLSFRFNQLTFKFQQKVKSWGLENWFVPQSLTAGLLVGLVGLFGVQNINQDNQYVDKGVDTGLSFVYRPFGTAEQELAYIQKAFIKRNEVKNAIAALQHFQTRYPEYGQAPLNKNLTKQEKISLIYELIEQKQIEQAIFVLYSIEK